MRGIKNRTLLCLLLFVICSLLPAYDFGLIYDHTISQLSSGDISEFEFKGLVIPRLSGLLGNNGEFLVSAGLNYQNNPWGIVPELLEANMFFGFYGGSLMMGRMYYRDQLGFIVDGIFDGSQLRIDTGAGVFGFGAFYTGFVCKRRVNVEMTMEEYTYNNAAIEYNDFFNTYFAPARAILALEWEHPNISQHLRLQLGLLGQFDLTGKDIHSQYFIAKMIMPFRGFAFEVGGCFNTIQFAGSNETAFAAEFGLGRFWQTQGLSFLARHSSGYSGFLTPFLPVTTVTHGNVYSSSIAGLTMFSLDYTNRLHRTLSFSLIPAYFIDNYEGNMDPLGLELYGQINWNPFSDIMFNIGGGVFLPSLGNVSPNSNNIWKVEANIIIAFF